MSAEGIPSPEKQLFYEQLLDALHSLFGGVHSGYRAIHAKGIVCAGTFTPAATVGSVRKRGNAAEAARRPARFVFDELTARLSRGAVRFRRAGYHRSILGGGGQRGG